MKEMKQFLSAKKNIEVIGLIGVIGSGKSHTARRYVSDGYQEIIIADEVKSLSHIFLNLNIPPKKAQEFKDSGIISIPNRDTSISVRDYYINVGQKLKLFFNDEKIWINKAIDSIGKKIEMGYDKIVVSDVRFPVELTELKNMKLSGYNIKIKFIFCNYISNRYKIFDSDSEKMAQHFLSLGYKDQDEIIFKTKDYL